MKSSSFSVKKKLSKSSSSILIGNNTNYFKNLMKYRYLFSHKSFIEILLGLIKDSQMEYLSSFSIEKKKKKSSKENKKMSVKSTKKILFLLKNSLKLINKKKKYEYNFNKNEKNEKQKVFHSSKEFKHIRREINQLKNINFQYENEIKKVDNLIELKNNHLYLIKSYDCFLEIFSENYSKSEKDYKDIDKLYIEKLSNERLNLSIIENKIIEQERDLVFLKQQINLLKKNNKKEEDIILFNKDIIKKDSKEYINTNSNNKNYENIYTNKKKVNFKININNNCKDKFNNNFFALKDCKYVNNFDKIKFNNNKTIKKDKFQRHRFSYPFIKNVNNSRKNLSQLFTKNNNNKYYSSNFLNFNNKSITDFDRTTISTSNDKTIESEKTINNTN